MLIYDIKPFNKITDYWARSKNQSIARKSKTNFEAQRVIDLRDKGLTINGQSIREYLEITITSQKQSPESRYKQFK